MELRCRATDAAIICATIYTTICCGNARAISLRNIRSSGGIQAERCSLALMPDWREWRAIPIGTVFIKICKLVSIVGRCGSCDENWPIFSLFCFFLASPFAKLDDMDELLLAKAAMRSPRFLVVNFVFYTRWSDGGRWTENWVVAPPQVIWIAKQFRVNPYICRQRNEMEIIADDGVLHIANIEHPRHAMCSLVHRYTQICYENRTT